MPKWSVGAAVPVSVAGVGNASVNLSLSNAKTITATATNISVVSIPTITFQNAINALSHKDEYFWAIANGKSYAMIAAYSVEGLQITYTVDTALSASATASIQASQAVNIGTSSNPLTANVSVSNSGQKVTISIPDSHFAFGEMIPVNELNPSQAKQESSKIILGSRSWITTCRTAGQC
jgi:hypothetical protein